MADNLTAPATGSVIAADDVDSVFYCISKIGMGDDGVIDGLVCDDKPLPVKGRKVQVAATELTRPANTTAYTAGDVVSNDAATTTLLSFASFARVNAGSGYIVGARLATDKKSITPRFRVHLYNASNPTVAADNAAHKTLYADLGKRIGSFDLPAMTTPVNTTDSTESITQDMTLRIPFFAAAATRTIYALLETLDDFSPANAQKFTLTLIGELD